MLKEVLNIIYEAASRPRRNSRKVVMNSVRLVEELQGYYVYQVGDRWVAENVATGHRGEPRINPEGALLELV